MADGELRVFVMLPEQEMGGGGPVLEVALPAGAPVPEVGQEFRWPPDGSPLTRRANGYVRTITACRWEPIEQWSRERSAYHTLLRLCLVVELSGRSRPDAAG